MSQSCRKCWLSRRNRRKKTEYPPGKVLHCGHGLREPRIHVALLARVLVSSDHTRYARRRRTTKNKRHTVQYSIDPILILTRPESNRRHHNRTLASRVKKRRSAIKINNTTVKSHGCAVGELGDDDVPAHARFGWLRQVIAGSNRKQTLDGHVREEGFGLRR